MIFMPQAKHTQTQNKRFCFFLPGNIWLTEPGGLRIMETRGCPSPPARRVPT